MWEKCVKDGEGSGDIVKPSTCWDGKKDLWENCENCPEDVWECTAFCGNGKIEWAEDCRNCEKDVWKCSGICGDGKIEKWEDCNNCSKDVKMCLANTCGDGKIDRESWEECDNGDKNGSDGKCTKMCTKYDSSKPKCGNGEIDGWEKCETCAIDLWEKCVKDGEGEKK